MRHATFTFNDAVFRVGEDVNQTGLDAEYVLYTLFDQPSRRETHAGLEYGAFLSRVEIVEGDPGFAVPSLDDLQAVRDFYPTYQTLPRLFRTAYTSAQTELLNAAANAPDLTPDFDPKKAEASPVESDATTSFASLTDTSMPSPDPS